MEKGAQHRGIGRYATELIEAMSDIDHENEYVYFVSNPKALPPKFKLHKIKYGHQTGKGEGLLAGAKMHKNNLYSPFFLLDKSARCFFPQLDPFIPVLAKRTPVVSVLYDLIPLYKIAVSTRTPRRLHAGSPNWLQQNEVKMEIASPTGAEPLWPNVSLASQSTQRKIYLPLSLVLVIVLTLHHSGP